MKINTDNISKHKSIFIQIIFMYFDTLIKKIVELLKAKQIKAWKKQRKVQTVLEYEYVHT